MAFEPGKVRIAIQLSGLGNSFSMGYFELVRQCLTYFRAGKIKLAVEFEGSNRNPFHTLPFQRPRKILKQMFTVLCTVLTIFAHTPQ